MVRQAHHERFYLKLSRFKLLALNDSSQYSKIKHVIKNLNQARFGYSKFALKKAGLICV